MKEFILLISFYLLGSARGTSGQPDELLDSMDHQASVQQLSSEYFSLANPSDVEALYETSSGEKALNEHGNDEHGSNEHAVGEHEHEHTSADQSSVEHTSADQSSIEHASADQSASEHPTEEQVSSEHPSDEPSSVEQGEKVEDSGDHNLGEQTSGEQALSTPFPSTSSGIAISCHTCAYMNDDGKCLRGEGVCTTQNSQQCMLKKIFEGGKLQFMVQGCENMCPSMNLFSHGTRMQIMCCRNEPLCNKI